MFQAYIFDHKEFEKIESEYPDATNFENLSYGIILEEQSRNYFSSACKILHHQQKTLLLSFSEAETASVGNLLEHCLQKYTGESRQPAGRERAAGCLDPSLTALFGGSLAPATPPGPSLRFACDF